MPRWAIIVFLLCIGGPSSVAAESLDGSRWLLAALPAENLLERVTVTLDFEEGRVAGTDGCNRFTGPYRLEDDELHIGDMASTRRGCAEPVMKQARNYMGVLDRARKAKIVDDSLQLFDANGELLAEFVPQLTALADTRWIVTGYNNGKQAVVSIGPDTSMTLEFDSENAISGTAGCNSFRGSYSSDSDNLTVGEIAATRRLCEDVVMAQEKLFLEALNRSASWRVEGNRLEIRDVGGAMLLIAKLAGSGSSGD
jgi:heat shock protein HslJ